MTAAEPIVLQRAEDLRNRRSLVLGLARSGVAAARFLADAGADVTAYDRRAPDELRAAIGELGSRPVQLRLGVSEAEARALVAGAELIVTSPSVSSRFPTTDPWLREALAAAEASGHLVVSEVELFLRMTEARVLGVTGTKGKTTTASLVAAMLERAGLPHALGGNIGTPLIEDVERLSPRHWAVLELSELQLPTVSRGADVAVYTNVVADHLDRHGTVAAYRAVKARLAELTSERGGTVVLNADDQGCLDLAPGLATEVLWYGHDDPHLEATVDGDRIVLLGRPLLATSEVRLPGRHMLSNVLAAALGASAAGAGHDAIATAVRDFRGVPHRLEAIGERVGVRWVNDSMATIPDAAIAALQAFDVSVVLIAGGQGKGLDLAQFVEVAVGRCRAAVLIGETADELEHLVAGRIPTARAATMDEAVELAAARARAGDVVLLAPAATSFDMFVDYAARGDAFRAAAERLGVHAQDGAA